MKNHWCLSQSAPNALKRIMFIFYLPAKVCFIIIDVFYYEQDMKCF